MKYGIQEIDHAVSVVADAMQAGNRMASIGFTVTPLSVMSNVGVANRLVLLRPQSPGVANFIELMSVLDERRLPAPLTPYVSGRLGFRWMVLSGPDVAASFEQLSRGGYPFGRPVPVERDWTLPSGEVLHLAFNVMMPIDAPIPFNFCEYRTPQHYVRPEFLEHPNGAETLTGILCQSECPDECLTYFEALFDCERRPLGGDLYAVAPNRVEVIVGAPSTWEHVSGRALSIPPGSPHTVIGCRIRVHDLSETQRYFQTNGLAASRSEVGLVVDSPLGDGTFLVFHS
jgi:hypothetical protein